MSTFSYQTPVQFWWKWILYKLTLVSQSGWPLPRVPLNQGGPPCSPPAWPPGPRQGWATGSDRFWLPELRVSRHFQTFYGSSVQSMDTQLDALPTLPVLARGVSGCVNSAFLDISRHFTAHLFSPWVPSSARGKGGGPLWKQAPTPERCPRHEPPGRNRLPAFTLCYKVSGPCALPTRIEPVDPRERDGND